MSQDDRAEIERLRAKLADKIQEVSTLQANLESEQSTHSEAARVSAETSRFVVCYALGDCCVQTLAFPQEMAWLPASKTHRV